MSTFAVDVNSSSGDIVSALNYALANLSDNTNLLEANVLVANITTGEISTTSTNSSGYTNNTIVSYLYQYMAVKYANTSTGSSGFTSNSRLANYYGLRNSANTTISNNPVDYVWFQAAGGFGTTKSLWYQTTGGRQIDFFVGNAAPANSYITVPDMPLSTSTPLNLDTITSAQNNQIVNVNAYYQANTTPATPAGGTYNFTTFTLTAPAGWSDTIPGFVANTTIYISQAAFVGNTNATAAPPATAWTVPAVYSSQFQGNTGATGPRGFLPMGFVITASDPTLFSNANLTTAFSSSRSNPSPPIGLGFAPIANDTAQFAYSDLFTGNTVTVVKQYDGSGWTTVVGNVISGGLFVPGSINANTLNANQVFALTIASTNANVGNVSSTGFWLQSSTGDARLAGNTSIGNNLTVGANAQIGGNLVIGNNASIGDNLTVANLITASALNVNTVNTSQLVLSSATQTVYLSDINPYPTINFVNGSNTNPTSSDFLWPSFTRGFAIGGGATIDATTDGSPDGSKILVNYTAYIHSATNPEYNLIELWKSGASNFYRSVFRSVRSVRGTDFTANVEFFNIVGDNGAYFYGNISNITQLNISTSSNFYDCHNISFSAPYFGYAFGTSGSVVAQREDLGGTTFVGNLAGLAASSGSTITGTPYPLFDIYGSSNLYYVSGPNSWQPTLLVGSGGTILFLTGAVTTYGAGAFVRESSGTFAELRDISADISPTARTLANVGTVKYVTVGTGGTILYNSRTYNSTGGTASSTGWSQSSSPTIADLNAVAANFTSNISANTWVAVGERGTILKSNNYNGPWTVANTVPTSQNLNGVDYINGYWVAVGDAGTILTSTDTDTWYGPVANPADGSISTVGARNLYGVAGSEITGQFMAAGEEIILTSNTAAPNIGGWNSNLYLGGTSVRSQLTRLQFFGSWGNIANVSLPPASQRVTNGTVVSGTYTDIDYDSGQTLTYYLVLGNMAGNVVITTNQPNMTLTEIKR